MTRAEIEAIVEEVRELAIPGGTQKVFGRDDSSFVLQTRGRGVTHLLLVDTSTETTRLHLVDSKPEQPQTPPAFVMLLRKHLVGTAVRAGALSDDDRIVQFDFERVGDEEARARTLVLELTGRHANAFLLDEEGRVLGAQRPDRGERKLRTGERWCPPPPPPPNVEPSDRWGLADLPVGERSEVVARHYRAAVVDQEAERTRAELRRTLTAEARRLRRLKKNIEGDLARAEEAKDFQRRAELLKSAYGQKVPRGASSVAVPDYYAPGAPMVEVDLDPAKSLQENIDRYFHEYRRLHDAQGRIEDRLLEVMEALDTVEGFRAKLDDADDADLPHLAERVEASDVVRRRAGARQQRRRSDEAPRAPYREFKARSGAAILVGRGAKQNDELTSRHARGRDTWLHARDWAGSHVILRCAKDGQPDGEDLLDAATLAAHFSKGKNDTLVDVTYTEAKHVRKPKGAAPGLVTVAGGSTIAVAIDEDRLRRLLESEVRG